MARIGKIVALFTNPAQCFGASVKKEKNLLTVLGSYGQPTTSYKYIIFFI